MTDLIATFTGLWDSTAAILPNLFASIVLLVVGYALGKIIGAAVETGIKKAKLENYIDVKVNRGLSGLFGTLTSWTIYLTFIQLAAGALGIGVVSSLWGSVIVAIPGLVQAAAIIIAGYVIGLYIENQVTSSRAAHSDLIGTVTFLFVVYLSIALGLSSVGLEGELVRYTLLIMAASVGIAFAIAVGSGHRERFTDLIRKMK